MMVPVLASLLALAAPEAALRTVTATAVDEKGKPVSGLQSSEVALMQDGAALVVTELVHESRPLTLALIVDTSLATGSSFRLHVIPAVDKFLAQLPAGSRYVLWTTGDRPTRVVEMTSEPAAAKRALSRLPTTGGNRVLDTLVEATKELREKEGERTAVVVVTGMGPGFTDYDRRQVVDQAAGGGTVFHAVSFDLELGAPTVPEGGGVVSRADYDYVLGTLSEKSGGRRETLLTPMGLDNGLKRVAAALGGEYRVTFRATGGDGKLEATVARPGVKLRLGQPR